MREGWELVTLKDVCSKGSSNITQSSLIDNEGEYSIYGASGLIKKVDFYQQEKPYIGIVKDGSGYGRIMKLEAKSSVIGTLQYLIPNEDINIDYFYYFLLGIDFRKYVQGAAIPHIYFKDYKDESFLKLPLKEQKQIVAILDKAFAAIDQAQANIEKNIENAKELFQSKLNEIFSQKGEGWEEKSLGELGKVSMCKRILKKQTNTESGIPFYKIGTFGKKANAFISEEIYNEFKNKYSFPRKGDILLSASGTIGRRVIYDGKPAYFQDSNIVWIANDEEEVLNQFLYEFYGFCDWNPSRGATISRLYNDDLRRIKIVYPSKETQKIIVQEIKELHDNTEAIEPHYQQKLDNLEDLKKSILQKAFSGQLSEPMIVND